MGLISMLFPGMEMETGNMPDQLTGTETKIRTSKGIEWKLEKNFPFWIGVGT